MKKLFVGLILILTLVLTGCGNGNPASKQNETSQNTASQAGKNAKDSTAKSTDTSTSTQTPGSGAIVAKSENIMSSTEKAELLNQVDKELDSLFSNINKLEDAQDADLDLNQ
ncbi:hypothetical protein [Desulfosporosinus sp. OT]|uniref:hypothetical protein n=1 Tax=Desulfosporosinus sp. OT TaxID=913865 RepID=UPI000223B186|nr:hypothetical protein [Desulfosporosinus sp. OT]EGW41617.1 putative lipoprotein [Desulfosporosinus sp. OT]